MSSRENLGLTPEERSLQEELRAMRPVKPDKNFETRLRRVFTTGNFDPAEGEGRVDTESSAGGSGRGRRGWWALAAAAAVVVASLMWFMPSGPEVWTVERAEGTGTVQVGNETVSVQDIQALEALLREGGRLALGDSARIDLRLGRALLMGISAGSVVNVPPAEPQGGHDYRAAVEGGELLVKTGPGFPGRRLLIATRDGRTELTGTTIVVNKMPDVTCVCVLEGTVRIGVDETDMEDVTPGKRKLMFLDGSAPEVVPILPGHRDHMVEFERRNEGAFR